MRSREPDSTCRPSGVKARLRMSSVWPRSRRTRRCLSRSQTRMAWSSQGIHSAFSCLMPSANRARLPSGEMATAQTASGCSASRLISMPVVRSHNRAVPSRLPLSRRLPSVEIAMQFTWAACPDSVRTRPNRRGRSVFTISAARPRTSASPLRSAARRRAFQASGPISSRRREARSRSSKSSLPSCLISRATSVSSVPSVAAQREERTEQDARQQVPCG